MQKNIGQQSDPNQPPKITTPVAKTRFGYVKCFGDLIKSAIVALFWTVIGCVVLTLAVISLTALYWIARLILRALGV